MNDSLKFLFARLKKPTLTREETERKVCQEVFIAKIGSDKELSRMVSFKGGLILDQLAKGKRGYTKDIDFDLIKYPLSEQGLKDFFGMLSPLPPYENISINVSNVEDLRHKNYIGKRVTLSFSDDESVFLLTVDVGVHLPLLKGNKALDYEIAFGGSSRLFVNPVERMIAEKLSTFAIYGTDNTRDKDLFDAYWLITNIRHDRVSVKRTLEELLVRRSHFFKTMELAKAEATDALTDKRYSQMLKSSRKNWTGKEPNEVILAVIEYLREL
ncbi:MAG: nucleotidyl transferase AbiEii/AbiGii toxin family protein [Bacilli bacterium]|nr:nucleotidyl transferase AbiEii/AbiGii toxin family protein [Bacilli bacterium]